MQPEPLLVIVNGGYRTGSTLVYNIVRRTLAHRGIDHAHGLADHPAQTDSALRKHAMDPHWRVQKTHVWRPLLGADLAGARILYTHRQPADVAASLLRHDRTWSETVTEVQRQALLTSYMHDPETVRLARPLIIAYERFWDVPGALVDRVASYLGLTLSVEKREAVAEETGREQVRGVQRVLGPGEQDENTLVQPGHIGPADGRPGTGSRSLTSAQIQALSIALNTMAVDVPYKSPRVASGAA